MKTLMTGLLLTALLLFPGCYTLLQVSDTPEDTPVVQIETSQPPVEYIPVYVPTPKLIVFPPRHPIVPAVPGLPPASHVSNPAPDRPTDPVSVRPIRTGRGSEQSTPVNVQGEQNNSGTRDSGARRH